MNKILHPVWQMTRKNFKKMFSRDFARGPTWHVNPSDDLVLNFHKKYPFIVLVPLIFLKGVITVFLHCDNVCVMYNLCVVFIALTNKAKINAFLFIT